MPELPANMPTGAPLPAWQGRHSWQLLETHFGNGLRFLALWCAWQRDPDRPHHLHVVALLPEAISLQTLRAHADADTTFTPLIDELARHWFGLLPGFHRLLLDGGRVTLTLCIGPTLRLLREQQFLADAIHLDATSQSADMEMAWDLWHLKALVRCCKRGTVLTLAAPGPALRERLVQLGFELPATGINPMMSGRYHPAWEVKRSHHSWARQMAQPRAPGSCVVIGAGLAGASAAAALARRGWQVTVLDTATEPAAGASGLPVGLMAPHTSADDSPRSRLSRCGIALTLQVAHQHLVQGQDWQASGVLELSGHGHPLSLPRHWPEGGNEGSRASSPGQAACASAPWLAGLDADAPALWHGTGAWVKPAQLVRAWLATPGVRFQGQANVTRLRRDGEHWQLLDAQNSLLACASHVVLASALDVATLLRQLQLDGLIAPDGGARAHSLQGTRGQVTWATQHAEDAAHLPPFPVNGLGSFIAHVPSDKNVHGARWYAGATFEPAERPPATMTENHEANLARLNQLLPAVAARLGTHVGAINAPGMLQAWSQTRCNSTDRLPVVGPLTTDATPSLWVSTAMGSRGISLAMLCAELLAAHMHAEPLPIEGSLARFLSPQRENRPK